MNSHPTSSLFKIGCWVFFFILLSYITSTESLFTSRPYSDKLTSSHQSVHYFSQTLDHFSVQDDRTFEQRYFVDAQHFRDPRTSPVILYICGESECGGVPINYLQQFAKKLGALIVAVEHRFYGRSMPFRSLSTNNLGYLSSRQAIADLAAFRSWYQTHVLGGAGNPWISVGGSYPGALSAWFRLKHPDLVVGALSSSGVIHAVYDFVQFDEQVAQSAGSSCSSALQAVTHALEDALMGSGVTASERRQVMAAFGAPVSGPELALGEFFYFLADTMAESIQYGYHRNVCEPTVSAFQNGLRGKDLWGAYADVVNHFWRPTFDPSAPLSYSAFNLQNTTADPSKSGRQWWWQKCSELAYFQTAPSKGSIRSSIINIPFHLSYCRQIFGESITPDTTATNEYYGALDIQYTASNIFFANGSQDPWQRASLVHPSSQANPSIKTGYSQCKDCGHCVDLRGCPSLPDNPPKPYCSDQPATELVRSHIVTNMFKWINSN